ncbi:MAG: EAL domain-containing protein [Nitrospiria bacterium]
MIKKTSKKTRFFQKIDRLPGPKFLAFSVLFIFLTSTILAWYYAGQKIERESRAFFEEDVNDARRTIDVQIQHYTDTLYGLQGLFKAYGEVSLAQWNQYIDSLDLKKRFPGIQDVTFSLYVPREGKKDFEDKIRKIYHNNALKIHPEGDRETFFPGLYVSSFQNDSRRKLGFDIGSDPVRFSTIERAMRSGKATATGKLTLEISQKPGFAIRVPIYKNGLPHDTGAERRRGLAGFVSISILSEELMDSLFNREHNLHVDLEIYDNGPVEKGGSKSFKPAAALLLYDRDRVFHLNNPGHHPRYEKISSFEIAGEEWVIYSSTSSDFHTSTEKKFPLFVLLSGMTISALLFGITWSVAASRVQLEEMARRVTLEWKESEEKFRAISQTARDAIISADGEGKIIYVNDEALRISGYSSEEIVGQHYMLLVPERFRPSNPLVLEKYLFAKKNSRSGKTIELTGTRKNQTEFPVELSLARWKSGKRIFFTAIVRDISDRKETEQALNQKNSFVQLLYAIATSANEAFSLEEALRNCVEIICRHAGWSIGHVYMTSHENGETRMVPSGIWYLDNPREYEEFRRITENTVLVPGEGLPGRVLESSAPLWIVLPTCSSKEFPRAISAEKAGIKTCLGFPILVQQEVVSVLEFFCKEKIEVDAAVLEAMAHIGTQLGRVVERKKAREQLDYIATHDSLTQIPNRILFSNRLDDAIAHAKGTGKLVAIMFVDLDQFKRINDSLGHTPGDLVIQEVARRLRGCVRNCDTVSRWGGDEFALIFENISRTKDIKRLCQKLLNVLSKPFDVCGQECFITASIGVSLFPDDGENEETLLRHADTAMFRAKERGRNTFQFFSQEMSAESSDKLVLENQLRHALERHEFVLYYQPLVDVQTEEIVGVEALIRWNHPNSGMIPPGKFIPLAEETGLIVQIGEWVLRTASAQNKAWQDMGLPPIRVAVNLSALQFQQSGMVKKIEAILKETRLSPRYLELELTESSLMHKKEETVSILRTLHDMGVHIAVDDFGTGYSSLSYIKRFPIDTLKIDRTFIIEMTTNPDDAAFARAIIAMAKSLKLKVIAEAVETADQLAFLKTHFCDEFQGFYFSPAVPSDVLTAILRDHAALKTKIM